MVLRAVHNLPLGARRFIYSEMLLGISIGIFAFLQNLHMLEVGLTEETIGEIASFSGIVMGLLSLPAVLLANRLGRKNILLLGILLLGISYLLFAIVKAVILFYLAQSLLGIGTIFLVTAESTLLYSYCETHEDEVRAYNFLFASFSLFCGLGTFIGGFLPLLLGGFNSKYQGGLFFAAFVMFILVIVRYYALPYSAKDIKNENAKTSENSMSQYKIIVKALIFLFLMGFSLGWIMSFLNVLIRFRFEAKDELISTILSFNALFLFLGSFLVPILFEKLGIVKSINYMLLLCAVFSVILFLKIPFIAFVIILFVRSGMVLMASNMIESRSLSIIGEENRNIFAGLRTISRNVGAAVSTYFTGLILAGKNYQTPFLYAGLAFLLMWLYFFVFVQKSFASGGHKSQVKVN